MVRLSVGIAGCSFVFARNIGALKKESCLGVYYTITLVRNPPNPVLTSRPLHYSLGLFCGFGFSGCGNVYGLGQVLCAPTVVQDSSIVRLHLELAHGGFHIHPDAFQERNCLVAGAFSSQPAA